MICPKCKSELVTEHPVEQTARCRMCGHEWALKPQSGDPAPECQGSCSCAVPEKKSTLEETLVTIRELVEKALGLNNS